MKNQTITLPVSEAKKSTFSVWCKKKNQLFPFVVEESVFNSQKHFQKVCGLKNNPHICSALLIGQADSTANIAVGIFYAHGLSYSSVPCGSLMAPLPDQGEEQRGTELFSFLPSMFNF